MKKIGLILLSITCLTLNFCTVLTPSQGQSLPVKTEQLRILAAKAQKFELVEAENQALIIENANQKADIKELRNQLSLSESSVIALRKQRNWVIVLYVFSIVFVYLARALFLKNREN